MADLPLSRDITRITLAVLFIGVLVAAGFWIMRPFLLALIWATTISVATWPIMLRLQSWLGGKRSLAVAGMTLALLLVFFVPFTLAILTIVDRADQIAGWVKGFATYSLPSPPDWVAKLPVVGSKLSEAWQDVVSAGPGGLRARLEPYAGAIVKWFVEQAGTLGAMFVQFLLTVVIAAILLAAARRPPGACGVLPGGLPVSTERTRRSLPPRPSGALPWALFSPRSFNHSWHGSALLWQVYRPRFYWLRLYSSLPWRNSPPFWSWRQR